MLDLDAIIWLDEHFKNIPKWVYTTKLEYFGGWSDYEECSNTLIFSNNGSLYSIEWTYCVMADDNYALDDFEYCCRKIFTEDAIEIMEEHEKINENIWSHM